jgi:hypothetical protein
MLSFLDQCQLPWILPDLTVYISNTAGVLEEAGTSQYGIQYVNTHNKTTQFFFFLATPKNQGLIQVLVKGKQYLLPLRHPPCYLYIQSSPVKFMAVGTDRGKTTSTVVKSYLRYLCCVFLLFFFVLYLVYPMLPVSLGCPFLIAPSVLSNVYIKHIDLVRLS